MVELRQKLSVVNNQRSQPTPRLNLDRLKCADMTEGYATELGKALPVDNNIAAMPLADHWHMVEQAISTAAEHKIGRLPRREKKEWFYEECRQAISEENAARARMLRHETRQNVEIYRRLRKQQTLLFPAKQRRFEESHEQLLSDQLVLQEIKGGTGRICS